MRRRNLLLWGTAAVACILGCLPTGVRAQASQPYFKIRVVDRQTGRGVPLVELRTVNHVRYVTDSRGIVAFNEPGLMDQDVFFFVQSHGYTSPQDPFGYRGAKLHVRSGGSAQITVQRVNISERLYRITGEGVYRDTVLVGEKPPTREPLLNGQVAGQDTVEAIPYRGKIYWFWGDTSRPSYPLGNFSTSGATSLLPAQGGLDPAVGIDLTYFVDKNGFCRGMAPLSEAGVVWIDALMTVREADGRESMLARYERLKALGAPLERGLMRFNDASQTFEPIARFELASPLTPQGHPFHLNVQGTDYLYFPTPYPNLRVRAALSDVQDLTHYEAYTPLVRGARFEGAQSKIERNAAGKPVWAWKRATAPLSPPQQRELIAAGKLTVDEFFDQEGGRVIYFEGTYTNQFTGTPETEPTPRYEYNQILYRLDLSDPRLLLQTPRKVKAK